MTRYVRAEDGWVDVESAPQLCARIDALVAELSYAHFVRDALRRALARAGDCVDGARRDLERCIRHRDDTDAVMAGLASAHARLDEARTRIQGSLTDRRLGLRP